MAQRWRILLPGVALLLAFLLTGCAGDGKSPSVKEYEASVVEARDRADSALAQIQDAESPDDFLERLDDAGELIEDAADELADAGSPPRFEDESERLVRHLRQLSTALHGTAAQGRDLGFDTFLTGASGLNFEAWDRVNTVLRELKRQGIKVQPLARH